MEDYEVPCQEAIFDNCEKIVKVSLPHGLTESQVNELVNGGETLFTAAQINNPLNAEWFHLDLSEIDQLKKDGAIYYFLDFKGDACTVCRSAHHG